MSKTLGSSGPSYFLICKIPEYKEKIAFPIRTSFVFPEHLSDLSGLEEISSPTESLRVALSMVTPSQLLGWPGGPLHSRRLPLEGRGQFIDVPGGQDLNHTPSADLSPQLSQAPSRPAREVNVSTSSTALEEGGSTVLCLPHRVPGQRSGKCPPQDIPLEREVPHTQASTLETLSLILCPNFQTRNRRSEAHIRFCPLFA